MIAVSRCILGEKCRYNGIALPRYAFIDSLYQPLLPLCPECAGGLLIPRLPCEIVGGDGDDVLSGCAHVLNVAGEDKTHAFVYGAEIALKQIVESGCQIVYLKARSPSCGVGKIYDGTFSKTLKAGNGVLTALLKRNNITTIEVTDDINF